MIIFVVSALAALQQTQVCYDPRNSSHADQALKCVILDGEVFVRLDNKGLRRTITGKDIGWSPPRNPHRSNRLFFKNGHYAFEGDRSIEEGHYRISQNSVWIKIPGSDEFRIVFYRSADGDLASGSFKNLDSIGRVTAIDLK